MFELSNQEEEKPHIKKSSIHPGGEDPAIHLGIDLGRIPLSVANEYWVGSMTTSSLTGGRSC